MIYTAHGSHFFKGAPLLNWLIFYPIEKFCSRWTDVLVTIMHEDYQLAKKKMYAKVFHGRWLYLRIDGRSRLSAIYVI